LNAIAAADATAMTTMRIVEGVSLFTIAGRREAIVG
jgi:hypothetical protein